MWIVYYMGSMRIKASFIDENTARIYHAKYGGDLTFKM